MWGRGLGTFCPTSNAPELSFMDFMSAMFVGKYKIKFLNDKG